MARKRKTLPKDCGASFEDDVGAGGRDAGTPTSGGCPARWHPSGNAVVAEDETRRLLATLITDDGTAVGRLCALAVAWVVANPTPTSLPTPGCRR